MNYINEINKLTQKLPRLFVVHYCLEVARSVEDLDTTGTAKACNDTLEGYLRGENSLDEVRANAAYSIVKGRKTKEKEYYELLLLRIKDFTELERIIYAIE